MQHVSQQPIGIFDSGIGGLTVAHAVTQVLPNESIIYFGDTAHLPYGDKSTTAIQAYSIKICEVLLKQQCKIILIACNSASATAFELVQEYVGKKAKVINVIDPVVHHLRENFSKKRVGLIGTKATVNSQVFNKKIDGLNNGIAFNALATPLLVPMIEEGFANKAIINSVIHEYLSHPTLQNVECLILGCTHYPLIKKQVAQYYQEKVNIIDSSEIVAASLKGLLEYDNLLNKQNNVTKKFFVSDYTDSFAATAKLFFQEDVVLEHYPLWD